MALVNDDFTERVAPGTIREHFNALNDASVGFVPEVSNATSITPAETTDVLVLTNTAARTVTLPAVSTRFSNGVGRPLTIKDRGAAGTNNITINRAGSDTIDGATSTTIAANNGVVRLFPVAAGTWVVL